MTGVTGTVMNPLCARLLEEGHTVVALVRPAKGISPEERLRGSLQSGRLFTIAGDITQELAGVSQEDQRLWAGKIEKVVHGAASIKFDETPQREVWRTNVEGTREILRLAVHLGIPEVHHMSTICVAGDTLEFKETDIPTGGGRNAYETSKIAAEAVLRERDWPLSWSIYRLPIIVGDSRTGRISSFTGYYKCAAPFMQLRQTIPERWGEQEENCRSEGILVEVKNGGKYIHIPLRVPCSPVGPLHIAPVDWVTEVLASLITIPADGKTFQVVHPNRPRVSDAFRWGLDFLGFSGITYWETQGGENHLFISRLQKVIARGLGPYRPYISMDRQDFGDAVLRATLRAAEKEYPVPPPMDRVFFARLLSFAIERNFGRPIQAPQTAIVGN